jgi:hypothetical protein
LHFPFVIFFAAHDVVEDELRIDPAGTDGGICRLHLNLIYLLIVATII